MLIYGLIALGALFRIVSHLSGFEIFPPNFAPIGAMALFGGFYLPRKMSIVMPLAAMFISDLVIGFYSLPVMFSVYISFILINFIGQALRQKKNTVLTFGGVISSSVLFFLVTNFAVWAIPNSMYSHNFQGLLASYIAGLPFLKFTLAGDLFFNGLFFTAYALGSQKKFLRAF
ncbi:MAG: hypothetical protein G01um10145_532 [Microgenomates group bacterium Gr01-1014_5]|nr:MAG: hypothetical protein G01um10145_532 [Microgenomates group bacterium Gr01-1014_5]